MHPSIACSLIDVEWCMPGSQSWMSALLDIALGTTETVYQKVPQALFGGIEIVWWIHRCQDIVLGNAPVECRDQSGNSGLTDQVVYVRFLQFFVTASRQLSQTVRKYFRFL